MSSPFKRTMNHNASVLPNYAAIPVPMKPTISLQHTAATTTRARQTEESALLKPAITLTLPKLKIAKPTSNAIVWSIITAVFMVSILIIAGTAVAINKSSEADARSQAPSNRVFLDDDGTYMQLNSITCTDPTITCNAHGICEDHYGCRCDEGYTTHKAANGTMCNYKQKSQLTAFLLTLFLGEFGAGRFYVGQILTAVIKLLLCVGSCGLPSILAWLAGIDWVKPAAFICCPLWIWCIVDIVLFAMNAVKDGNDVSLEPM